MLYLIPAPLHRQGLRLAHAVRLVRPLLQGQIPQDVVLHVGVLLVTAFAAYWVALVLTRRRLLK